MTLAPTIIERLARARGDLRMGVPVVLTAGAEAALAVAVEPLGAARLADLRALGAPELALTLRRAETLKARAYDGDLARLAVPADLGVEWLAAMADPADDLRVPMKGPFLCLRDGSARLHRAALHLAKSAHLLPAALLVRVADGPALAASLGLTLLPLEQAEPELLRASPLSEVVSARLPMVASDAGRVHIFRPEDGSEEHFFAGDTLFQAGVGNCKNGGEPGVLFTTIQSLKQRLSPRTILHPGHDYLQRNLEFAHQVDPHNEAVVTQLAEIAGQDTPRLPPRPWSKELQVNPFLRTDSPDLRKSLATNTGDDEIIFKTLRKLRDNW